jgi:hypothetical protein
MMDSTTGRARPLVAVGYGPRCIPVMQLAEAAAGLCDQGPAAALDWRDGSGNHIVAVVGSTDDEEQLQAAYRLLHQEVMVSYTDVRN